MIAAQEVTLPTGPAWLIKGPQNRIPGDDLWETIQGSLAHAPERIRLASDECQLSGAALLDGAHRLARLLPTGWVAVAVMRSAALVQVVLGIWCRGSAYVPVATELPGARIAAIIDVCRPAMIVTDQPSLRPEGYLEARTLAIAGRDLVLLERMTAEVARPRECAYVAHTSGTTGVPKTILVGRSALLNRLGAMQRIVCPVEADRVMFKTSLAFDVHVWEFAFPLSFGATVVVFEQKRFFDLRAVCRLLADEAVTIAGFVPSLLGAVLEQPGWREASHLRLMFCGGENWSPTLAARFYALLPDCALRNSYGPAETTLAVANWLVPRNAQLERIELGPPLDNTLFLLEDASRKGDEVTGTLAIGGAQVADGYLNKPIPDPFATLEIEGTSVPLYRSGDVVSLDIQTGALVFRGRLDQQVKINGVRIEIGDVEAALLTLDDIEACAVFAIGEKNRRLLATFKVRRGRTLDIARARYRCSELLPPTHVPAQFWRVESYALNPSGKVDRSRTIELIEREQALRSRVAGDAL